MHSRSIFCLTFFCLSIIITLIISLIEKRGGGWSEVIINLIHAMAGAIIGVAPVILFYLFME